MTRASATHGTTTAASSDCWSSRGIYNRSRYDREVTAALVRWSEHVLSQVERRESKVVSIAAAQH
ncbi:MAG: hypothetical protein JO283_21205 [Bradyrhizobium sp.]|nr:hypothetical protein [Bradyrhizobium sp.]